MNLKIVKVLLVSVLVWSAITSTTMITINSHQMSAPRTSETILTSERQSSGIVLVGDPLPGDGWPKGGNHTGNQTK